MKLIKYTETWNDQEIERNLILSDEAEPMASLQILFEPGYWPEIQAVWVEPKHRNQGLARILLINAIVNHELDEHQGLQLQVRNDNFIKATYEALGFEEFGEVTDGNLIQMRRAYKHKARKVTAIPCHKDNEDLLNK